MLRSLYPLYLVGAAALALAFVLPETIRLQLYLRFILPWAWVSLLGAIVSVGVVCLIRWRSADTANLRGWLIDAFGALAATILIANALPLPFSLETDESAFIASADAIRFTGGALVPNSGIYSEAGILHATTTDLEKRGVMYPALLALVMGWLDDPNQATYWLNLASGWLLLLLTARITRSWRNCHYSSLGSIVALASFSLIGAVVGTGTYDLLNAVLLLAVVGLTRSYWIQPERYTAIAAAFCGSVAAQLRYESIAIVGLAMIVIAYRGARNTQNTNGDRLLPQLLPFLLVPGAWRFAVPADPELPAGIMHSWGLDHFFSNAGKLLVWTFNDFQTGSVVIAIIALFGAAATLVRVATKKAAVSMTAFIPIMLLLVLLGILCFSYWGRIDRPMTARYFVLWPTALAIVAALTMFSFESMRAPRLAMPILLLGVFGAVHAAQQIKEFQYPASVPQHTNQVLAELQASYGNCNVLLVTDFPLVFITRNRGAIFPDDWTVLGPAVNSWAPQLGVRMVLASSLSVPGMGRHVGQIDLEAWSKGAPIKTLHSALAVSKLLPLWTDPSATLPCAPVTRKGIDPTDLRGAIRLWETVVARDGRDDRTAPAAH